MITHALASVVVDFGQFRFRPISTSANFDFGQFRLRPISTSANFDSANSISASWPKSNWPKSNWPKSSILLASTTLTDFPSVSGHFTQCWDFRSALRVTNSIVAAAPNLFNFWPVREFLAEIHIAKLVLWGVVLTQNGWPITIHRTNYLHVDVQWHQMGIWRQWTRMHS